MDGSPSLTDGIAAAGSLLAALTAVVLLFLAYRQMRAANDQAKTARARLRRLEEQERERAGFITAQYRLFTGDDRQREKAASPLHAQTAALRDIEQALAELTAAVRGESTERGEPD